VISGHVAQDLRQLARGELSRSTGAVAELGKPPQHLLHRPPFTTVNSAPSDYAAGTRGEGTDGGHHERDHGESHRRRAGWVGMGRGTTAHRPGLLRRGMMGSAQ
jgi:hypothetical protein